MQVEAVIHSVGQVQQITDKFSKRVMIATVDPESKYPAHLSFDTTGDKMSLLDDLNKGDKIKIDFNLNGRLHTNKDGVEVAYNSLSIWKIEVLEKSQSKPQGASMPPPPNM